MTATHNLRRMRGAISELRVAQDLLERGYELFTAIHTTLGSCDLIGLKDGKLLRVEIKTGQENSKGQIYPPLGMTVKADVLAIVLPTRIVYSKPV